jgi:malonate transporter MadL subunit
LVIYGVAFLAGCMIAGLFLGEVLGALIGVQANVGGVGIAMLFMILFSDRLRKAGKLTQLTERGVLFWSSIYIPIVVAMAAKQNVTAAVKGGPAAILAGAGAVVVCFMLVPVLSRVGVDPALAEGGHGIPSAVDSGTEETASAAENGSKDAGSSANGEPGP